MTRDEWFDRIGNLDLSDRGLRNAYKVKSELYRLAVHEFKRTWCFETLGFEPSKLSFKEGIMYLYRRYEIQKWCFKPSGWSVDRVIAKLGYLKKNGITEIRYKGSLSDYVECKGKEGIMERLGRLNSECSKVGIGFKVKSSEFGHYYYALESISSERGL